MNSLEGCASAGPLENDSVAAHERAGPLWDQFRKFERAGLAVDAKSYATAFRVGDKPGSETVASLVSDLPEGEQTSVVVVST